MIFKTIAKENYTDDNGKNHKLKYINVTDCQFYAEAEMATQSVFPNAEVNVVKTNLREIVNPNDAKEIDSSFIAKITAQYELDGKVKRMKYNVLVFAKDFDDARSRMKAFLQQGYDNMELTDLKESKIEGYIQ